MFIKKGDTVEIITGADKGKSGKVVLALPKENKVIVEGINRRKHHQRPKRANQKGQVVEKAMPIHVSNVRLAKK
ncbi:MAG: 50S ribosomal protein L24 [Parcubacteria group bacterium GW2011_GWB1_44_7]|nr:MAG: 50S ribosomal protein L24 [Parcubacteria group bacterium GW2011_GWB1_44_7]